MKRIYVDHNATTPPSDAVIECVAASMAAGFGNASSLHRDGAEARRRLERARARVATFVGADADEIVFTSGGTEADNLAVIGAAREVRANDPTRNRVLVSAVEHHAVLGAADALADEGFRVERVPVTAAGVVDPDTLRAMCDARVALVAIQWVNGETGVVQPLARCADVAHDTGAVLHTDAVQAAGRLVLADETGGPAPWDTLALSGHKLYGPPGVGALVVRRGAPIRAILHGGGHERSRRSGSLPVALIEGFAVACEGLGDGDVGHLGTLTTAFESMLLARRPDACIHGRESARVAGTTNVSCPGTDAEAVLIALDMRGVSASSGSACTTGAVEPSHVLAAMGVDRDVARAAIRISFGRDNTMEDVSSVVDAMIESWTHASSTKESRT